MAATENNENAVKETKRNEDYKSPGRLKAEEKAERIRIAEEYRKKLEAENAALPPKKTKAAEQKEQEKIEKAERELAERKAQLEEETRSASQRISDAVEKIESLKEKIERTEADLAAKKDAADDISEAEAQSSAAEVPESVAIDDLVIKVPVVSFSVPCAVKYKKQSPAPAPAPCAPPMAPPMICITNVIQSQNKEETQKCDSQEADAKQSQVQFKTQTAKPRFAFVAPPTPSPKSAAKSKPTVRSIDITSSFRKNDAFKPAITYGSALCEGGWEDEQDDDVDIPELDIPASKPADEIDLISELELVSEAADSSVSEIEKITEELENAINQNEQA